MAEANKVLAKETKKKTRKATPKAVKSTVAKKVTKPAIGKYFSEIKANFRKNKNIYARYIVITLIVVVIGVFAFLQKSWFIVAVVNGQPITTVEYYQNLKAQSGKDVLDQMVRNKLIFQEATKKGVSVTEKDIDKKLTEIEKQVGGKEQLKSALEARNISQKDFRIQVKVQLIVEKLLEKDIAVTEKEIDDFITKNPTDASVTGEAGPNRVEIKSQLRSQKLNEKYQSWYDSVEKAAKISRF